MTKYRRAKFEGGFYFFTVVTYKRRKFLTSNLARKCLRQSFQSIRQKSHFDVVAICLLDDHLHCIWKLPDGDCDFSYRWSVIKSQFTSRFISAGGWEISQSLSRDAESGSAAFGSTKSKMRKICRSMWTIFTIIL